MYEKYVMTSESELNDYSESNYEQQVALIADRYGAEKTLLDAIRSGNEKGAIDAFYAYSELMSDPRQEQLPTTEDPLRDFKNSLLVMNTLFRKAAESNSVHPIYLHKSSSYFGVSIEEAEELTELYEILRDMVHVYCEIVRQSSLANYSPLIQNALLYIDMHLASPITTRDIAASQFVSANYLSSRFRKEVGICISEHILRKKIALSEHLLSTAIPIQEVAEKIGMDDPSYFSKQFRKLKGCSPQQFRKKLAETD